MPAGDRREEALLLADEGAQVVVNYLGGGADGSGADRGPAQHVVEEILAAGGSAAANTDDISSWAGAVALMGLAVERFGGIDVVANNAGILRDLGGSGVSKSAIMAILQESNVCEHVDLGHLRHQVTHHQRCVATHPGLH